MEVDPPKPYTPAGQGVQAKDAPPVEYVPAGQGPVHAAVVSPVVDP